MNELIVLLPAYNEEDNIESLVGNWQSLCEQLLNRFNLSLQIIVVNDGSDDRTVQICERLVLKYNNFNFLNHSENNGLGAAVRTGIIHVHEVYPYAKYVCLMDCDNTHNPKYVIEMLKRADGSNIAKPDVVIASRYQSGATVKGVPKLRLLTSEGAKFVFRILLNIRGVQDYTCGYRLYSKEILDKALNRYGEDIVEEPDFTCMAELLYKLYLIGASFKEIPFELRYDYKLGQSKMKVLKTALKSIKLVFRLRRLKPQYNRGINNDYIKTKI